MSNGIGGFSPVFVFIAYTVVWVVLFAYVFYLAHRQREVRQEINDLRRELALRGGHEGPTPSP